MKPRKTRTITFRATPEQQEGLKALGHELEISIAKLIVWLAFDVLPAWKAMTKKDEKTDIKN